MKLHSETNTITDVSESNGWYSVRCGSMGTGVNSKYGVIPKVGDIMTVHSTTMFGTIRGIEINGKMLFFKSDQELEDHRKKELQKYEQKKIDDFVKNKSKLDLEYESLPQVFKDRIDRFRTNNPDFRVGFESYELFCCTEAVNIAESLKTVEEVKLFWDLSYDKQLKLVPALNDGHSGNTFGCACKLAVLYLESPEMVARIHGSLSPLVGSATFGDIEK